MELLDYIRKNYKTPNIAVLKTLGATDELIKYLVNTPNNTNIKVVESLINEGGSDEGNGIKSITISPAITTTPALESLFPIYYDDLTEEQKADGISLTITTASVTPDTDYTFTATPTSGWYIVVFGDGFLDDPTYVGEPDEAVEIASITANSHGEVTGTLYVGVATGTPNESDFVMFLVTITMNA